MKKLFKTSHLDYLNSKKGFFTYKIVQRGQLQFLNGTFDSTEFKFPVHAAMMQNKKDSLRSRSQGTFYDE